MWLFQSIVVYCFLYSRSCFTVGSSSIGRPSYTTTTYLVPAAKESQPFQYYNSISSMGDLLRRVRGRRGGVKTRVEEARRRYNIQVCVNMQQSYANQRIRRGVNFSNLINLSNAKSSGTSSHDKHYFVPTIMLSNTMSMAVTITKFCGLSSTLRVFPEGLPALSSLSFTIHLVQTAIQLLIIYSKV